MPSSLPRASSSGGLLGQQPRAGTPGLRIRRADLVADRDGIVALLGRHFGRALLTDGYDWLFFGNPAGQELVWLAEDATSGEVVGVAAGYPRRMRVDAVEVMALNLGYFAFDTPYRSLGPALELLRVSLEPVRLGEFAFAYDHPSESMLAIYRRMGGMQVGRMQRWVRLLSCRHAVALRCGEGLLGRLLGSVGDAALRARAALEPAPRGIDVALLEGPCTEEFDALDDRLRGACRIEGVRSAAYLNWRYLQSITWRHEVLCARRRGELVGYVVLRLDREWPIVTLVEMAPAPESDVRRALLVGALAYARERGARALVAHGLADSAVTRIFRELGFIRRQVGSSFCAVAAAESPLRQAVGHPHNWWIIEGDRDV